MRRIIAIDLEIGELRKSQLSRDAYQNEAIESLKKLAAWLAINQYMVLAEYGYRTVSDIGTKKETVSHEAG